MHSWKHLSNTIQTRVECLLTYFFLKGGEKLASDRRAVGRLDPRPVDGASTFELLLALVLVHPYFPIAQPLTEGNNRCGCEGTRFSFSSALISPPHNFFIASYVD